MSETATDPSTLARLVARFGEERGAQAAKMMAEQREAMRVAMERAAALDAPPDQLAAMLEDVLREEFADVATQSSTGRAAEQVERLVLVAGSAIRQMARTAQVNRGRLPDARAIGRRQARPRGASRAHRPRARTGSSLSRGDPSEPEGDKPEPAASPQAGAGNDRDSGMGGAR
jgi:hypothetical protein